jgi:hypothetical protein
MAEADRTRVVLAHDVDLDPSAPVLFRADRVNFPVGAVRPRSGRRSGGSTRGLPGSKPAATPSSGAISRRPAPSFGPSRSIRPSRGCRPSFPGARRRPRSRAAPGRRSSSTSWSVSRLQGAVDRRGARDVPGQVFLQGVEP